MNLSIVIEICGQLTRSSPKSNLGERALRPQGDRITLSLPSNLCLFCVGHHGSTLGPLASLLSDRQPQETCRQAAVLYARSLPNMCLATHQWRILKVITSRTTQLPCTMCGFRDERCARRNCTLLSSISSSGQTPGAGRTMYILEAFSLSQTFKHVFVDSFTSHRSENIPCSNLQKPDFTALIFYKTSIFAISVLSSVSS